MSEFADGFKAGSVSMGKNIIMLGQMKAYFGDVGAFIADIRKEVEAAQGMPGKERDEVE